MTISPVSMSGNTLSLRLARLAPLTATTMQKLADAERDRCRWRARHELVREGEPVREGRVLLSGWACRQHILADGRRQILSFVLPGDLIDRYSFRQPLAAATILTITDVTTCIAPSADGADDLAEAYARSAAFEEHQLLGQVVRLGRFNAYERLTDWLLETRDRLARVGLSNGDQFALPLTQEILADALGLTSVHLNRTLQAMRRDGLVKLQAGMVSLLDPRRMEKVVNYGPTCITSAD